MPLIPDGVRRMLPRRVLVCSIGNPGTAYQNTRHSAGHFVNELIRSHLDFPEWSRGGAYGGLVSQSPTRPEYTLWKSPSLMNVSGKHVVDAWKAFRRELGPEEKRAVLVILHDDLERQLGKVRLRLKGSAQGHNGIKSIIQKLGSEEFRRIGVGIDRPESRDAETVAKYVLGKFNEYEKRQIQNHSLSNVMGHLKQIAKTPLSGGTGLSGVGDAERGNRLPPAPKEARSEESKRTMTPPPTPFGV